MNQICKRLAEIFRHASFLLLFMSSGCTTVAQVTSLSDQDCRRTFVEAIDSMLVEEGEAQMVADQLAESATAALSSGSFGPRPFVVASSSGVDYGFFVQQKSGCVLRLYSRQKGFMRYRNNMTYISTRELEHCTCAE